MKFRSATFGSLVGSVWHFGPREMRACTEHCNWTVRNGSPALALYIWSGVPPLLAIFSPPPSRGGRAAYEYRHCGSIFIQAKDHLRDRVGVVARRMDGEQPGIVLSCVNFPVSPSPRAEEESHPLPSLLPRFDPSVIKPRIQANRLATPERNALVVAWISRSTRNLISKSMEIWNLKREREREKKRFSFSPALSSYLDKPEIESTSTRAGEEREKGGRGERVGVD